MQALSPPPFARVSPCPTAEWPGHSGRSLSWAIQVRTLGTGVYLPLGATLLRFGNPVSSNQIPGREMLPWQVLGEFDDFRSPDSRLMDTRVKGGGIYSLGHHRHQLWPSLLSLVGKNGTSASSNHTPRLIWGCARMGSSHSPSGGTMKETTPFASRACPSWSRGGFPGVEK